MSSSNSASVHVVFNIDTEGPMTETLSHTFMRVREIFGLHMEPTPDNLKKLQRGDYPGLDEETNLGLKIMLAPERLTYLRNWEQIDEMLDRFLSPTWRNSLLDSWGQGWVYSFYAVDRVGFDMNTMRRPIGYHHVYDFYREKLGDEPLSGDRIYWHLHGKGFVNQVYLDSMNLHATDTHIQVLARRILDRFDFPACFRPGMDMERPDHNLFLEMWIPFDYANQGAPSTVADLTQRDNGPGRFGDWRRAPMDWSIYHPDWYDYQKPGAMKRYIARCLYTKARFRQITQAEVDKAFLRAQSGQDTVLSVCCHDGRDMTEDLAVINPMLQEASRKFPDVPFRFGNAVDAMRRAEKIVFETPLNLSMRFEGSNLMISSDRKPWGPQPFFCFRTWDHRYYHDNLERHSDTSWSYTFDWQTVDMRAIHSIGLATNDDFGNTTLLRWNADLGQFEERFRNAPADINPTVRLRNTANA